MSDFNRSKRGSSSFPRRDASSQPRRSFGSNNSDRSSFGEDRPFSRDDRRDDRPFRGDRSSSSRFGGGGRRFGGGGGRRFGGSRSASNDYSKYIKKAEPVTEEVYTPNNTFQDFKINSALKDNVTKRGFKNPTPIQDQAIP